MKTKKALFAADIAGVVTGANGPEAGVWGIAEISDLPHDEQVANMRKASDLGGPLVCAQPTANSQ